MTTDGRLAVADQRLEFARIAGRRPGPTLVLLHEGLGCVELWKSFPARLADATGLAVFSYSRAGYGGSSPVELPRPLDFHEREAIDVLPRLLDAAGIGECVLIGHSDGASIALIYAGATSDPRVRAVAVLAPHVLTEAKCVRNIRAATRAYAVTKLRDNLRRYHRDNVDIAFRGWSGAWCDPGFVNWNIEHYLPAIRVPVLTIRGDDDPYNSDVHVERIVRGVRGPVSRVDLAGCGHAPHSEQPQVVIGHIVQLLEAIEPRDEASRRP